MLARISEFENLVEFSVNTAQLGRRVEGLGGSSKILYAVITVHARRGNMATLAAIDTLNIPTGAVFAGCPVTITFGKPA